LETNGFFSFELFFRHERKMLYSEWTDEMWADVRRRKPVLKGPAWLVYLNYKNGNIRLQLARKEDPPVHAPYGITKYVEKDADEAKKLDAENSLKKSCDFVLDKNAEAFWKNFDEIIIKIGIENRDTYWPKKTMTPERIRDMYLRCVDMRDDVPHLRTKVKMLDVEILNYIPPCKEYPKGAFSEANPREWEKRKFDCLPIVEVACIWITTMQWGCSLNTTNLLVQKPTNNNGFAFQGWSSEELPRNLSCAEPPRPSPPIAEAQVVSAAPPQPRTPPSDKVVAPPQPLAEAQVVSAAPPQPRTPPSDKVVAPPQPLTPPSTNFSAAESVLFAKRAREEDEDDEDNLEPVAKVSK
jgi:hypothetical protein